MAKKITLKERAETPKMKLKERSMPKMTLKKMLHEKKEDHKMSGKALV